MDYYAVTYMIHIETEPFDLFLNVLEKFHNPNFNYVNSRMKPNGKYIKEH